MVWEPEIVVAQIGHETASRFSQCGMSMNFALPRTLRKIKEANGALRPRQLGNAPARLLRRPVAHNENLKILEGLCLNARNGVMESFGMVVGWN